MSAMCTSPSRCAFYIRPCSYAHSLECIIQLMFKKSASRAAQMDNNSSLITYQEMACSTQGAYAVLSTSVQSLHWPYALCSDT